MYGRASCKRVASAVYCIGATLEGARRMNFLTMSWAFEGTGTTLLAGESGGDRFNPVWQLKQFSASLLLSFHSLCAGKGACGKGIISAQGL